MDLVEGCGLTGEPARQLINSATRELSHISADQRKLRKRFVLVPVPGGAADGGGTPRGEGSDGEGDGQVAVVLPAGVSEADVGLLFDPKEELSDSSDHELGTDLAAAVQQIGIGEGDTIDKRNGDRNGSAQGAGTAGAAAMPPVATLPAARPLAGTPAQPPSSAGGGGRDAQPPLVLETMSSSTAAATMTLLAEAGDVHAPRLGTGGFAWVFGATGADSNANPGATVRAAAPPAAARAGRRGSHEAFVEPPRAPAAPGAAPPPAEPGQSVFGRVSMDASLREKGMRLREILSKQLGGASALEEVMRVAKDDADDSEATLAGKLGERADLLLPIVHTLVEVEWCLESAEEWPSE